MGWYTKALGVGSTSMGFNTRASGDYSTAMGHTTTASGFRSTAMGVSTTASGQVSTAMGNGTPASGSYCIAMGVSTTASGWASTAMGWGTTASGANSTAQGANVSTNSMLGSFIIGDNSTSTIANSSASNEMTMRFAGGYRLFTNSDISIGVSLAASGNSWASISDSNRKENFKPVNGEELLAKIRNFRLTSWNYKGQDKQHFRHYGPMAQDFFNAFGHDGIGVIGNDTTIASADFDGVNLIAIQALEKRTQDLQKENTDLKSKLTTMEVRLQKLEQLLTSGGSGDNVASVKK
jgi:hypothetical protein